MEQPQRQELRDAQKPIIERSEEDMGHTMLEKVEYIRCCAGECAYYHEEATGAESAILEMAGALARVPPSAFTPAQNRMVSEAAWRLGLEASVTAEVAGAVIHICSAVDRIAAAAARSGCTNRRLRYLLHRADELSILAKYVSKCARSSLYESQDAVGDLERALSASWIAEAEETARQQAAPPAGGTPVRAARRGQRRAPATAYRRRQCATYHRKSMDAESAIRRTATAIARVPHSAFTPAQNRRMLEAARRLGLEASVAAGVEGAVMHIRSAVNRIAGAAARADCPDERLEYLQDRAGELSPHSEYLYKSAGWSLYESQDTAGDLERHLFAVTVGTADRASPGGTGVAAP